MSVSDPFVGEIRLFSYDRIPNGWTSCQGQTMSISQNQALFSLLGTTYGGDGVTIFKLPDLRGRVPIHFSQTLPIGHVQGEEAHTLTTNEIPAHMHFLQGSADPLTDVSPQNNVWGLKDSLYGAAEPIVQMSTASISNSGGSLPHSNMQPYLAVTFCIALVGIYPSRS
jgi:microcystin-dependent protein